MNFDFNDEQKMLQKGARDFFEKECPKSLVRQMAADEKGNPPELWKKMAQLGWLGLIYPEQYGGGAGTMIDLVALEEEMGRACLPGAFFSTVLLGGLFILNAGSEEQKNDLLTKIGKGETILTLALTESTGSYEAAAVETTAVSRKRRLSLSTAPNSTSRCAHRRLYYLHCQNEKGNKAGRRVNRISGGPEECGNYLHPVKNHRRG